jgi:hypothetical protein
MNTEHFISVHILVYREKLGDWADKPAGSRSHPSVEVLPAAAAEHLNVKALLLL